MKRSWRKAWIGLFLATLALVGGPNTMVAGVGPEIFGGYIVDCDEDPFGSNSSLGCGIGLCNGLCCEEVDRDCTGSDGVCRCDEACFEEGGCCEDAAAADGLCEEPVP